MHMEKKMVMNAEEDRNENNKKNMRKYEWGQRATERINKTYK